MAITVSTLHCYIERIVHTASWRGTRYATFKRTDGWLLCEVYFESAANPLPRMQIRSNAPDLEVAAAVAVAIQMASEWAVEELGWMKELSRGVGRE